MEIISLGVHGTHAGFISSHHVDNSQDASAVPELGCCCIEVVMERNVDEAESQVRGEISHDEEELQAGREGPDVDGRAQLDLAVVPLPRDGSVEQVLLEPR